MKNRGSALVIALWAIVMLSMLVAATTFNMHMEAGITTHYRKRMKAASVARGGVEWAKLMLYKSTSAFSDEDVYGEQFRIDLKRLARGNALGNINKELGEGQFRVSIIPEQGRRNVNHITEEDWKEIFDQTGVPNEIWDELIDTLGDWVDENDLHLLNGAESDDNFYKEKGYEVKNAPLDTIDELLLIKGWDENIVYGGPSDDPDEPHMRGFANLLTTWGDGKINVNTANRGVLMTVTELDEFAVDALLEARMGLDGAPGTEDDGFTSVGEAAAAAGIPGEVAAAKFTVRERRYIRIISIGEVQGVKSGVWSIFLQEGRQIKPVFWREAPMS